MRSAANLLAMITKGLTRLRTDFDAMVIANQAVNFFAGANLMLILMTAQEQEWTTCTSWVRQFQNVTLAIKHAPKPVVVAPQGLALGGGCEIAASRDAHPRRSGSLHGTRRNGSRIDPRRRWHQGNDDPRQRARRRRRKTSTCTTR